MDAMPKLLKNYSAAVGSLVPDPADRDTFRTSI
jgi:hypothetical protein